MPSSNDNVRFHEFCVCTRGVSAAACLQCAAINARSARNTRISRAYAHILAFFSTDVKRRQSLYDEDSLDGDHPSENEGITFSRAVSRLNFFFSLFFFFALFFPVYLVFPARRVALCASTPRFSRVESLWKRLKRKEKPRGDLSLFLEAIVIDRGRLEITGEDPPGGFVYLSSHSDGQTVNSDFYRRELSGKRLNVGVFQAEREARTARRSNRSPRLFSGRDSTGSAKDVDRAKLVRERQNEERQRKLEELRQQALAAQRFREQREEERRKRIDELRSRDNDRFVFPFFLLLFSLPFKSVFDRVSAER